VHGVTGAEYIDTTGHSASAEYLHTVSENEALHRSSSQYLEMDECIRENHNEVDYLEADGAYSSEEYLALRHDTCEGQEEYMDLDAGASGGLQATDSAMLKADLSPGEEHEHRLHTMRTAARGALGTSGIRRAPKRPTLEKSVRVPARLRDPEGVEISLDQPTHHAHRSDNVDTAQGGHSEQTEADAIQARFIAQRPRIAVRRRNLNASNRPPPSFMRLGGMDSLGGEADTEYQEGELPSQFFGQRYRSGDQSNLKLPAEYFGKRDAMILDFTEARDDASSGAVEVEGQGSVAATSRAKKVVTETPVWMIEQNNAAQNGQNPTRAPNAGEPPTICRLAIPGPETGRCYLHPAPLGQACHACVSTAVSTVSRRRLRPRSRRAE